jgi:hypothetical protein
MSLYKTNVRQVRRLTDTELFLKAVTEYYAEDDVAPGLVAAWLPDCGKWYVSLRRYGVGTGAMLHSNVELTAVSRTSLENALRVLRGQWRLKALSEPQWRSNLKEFLFQKEDPWRRD